MGCFNGLIKTNMGAALFILLMSFSSGVLALDTATVASSLEVTSVCPIFDGGMLDYVVETSTGSSSSGIAIYSGSLSTATWSQTGTVGSDSFSRTIRCSRDSSGTTYSTYNRWGVPSTSNYVRYLTHTTAGSPSSYATVDSTKSGASPIEAIHDAADNLYVLFSSSSNYHLAYRDATTGTWTTHDIDTSGDISDADMVLVDDLPVVALYDSSAKDVIIAKVDASLSTWTRETAASTGDVGDSVSLAADSDGHLHLIYHNDGGGSYYTLEYASDASGSWITETADATAAIYMYETEIAAITPNLIAVAAFAKSSDSVIYLTRTSTGWGSTQTVEAADYNYLDLSFDQGDVAISYFDSSDDLKVSYSICGDGVKSDFEECDDGNSDNTDACTNECQLNCGDGTLQTDEECDDGNASDIDACTTSCKNAVCGDGYVWYHKESCDDGNTTDGDWCGANCKTEAPPTANAGPDQNVRWKIGTSLPPQVYLNGTSSTDPEAEVITYAWTMTAVPSSSAVTTASIINATNPRPAFRPDVVGTYTLTLTVTDADTHTHSDTVDIRVRRY